MKKSEIREMIKEEMLNETKRGTVSHLQLLLNSLSYSELKELDKDKVLLDLVDKFVDRQTRLNF